ncbi:GNAT family N-acetyltransferase [Fulvivirgaceae bacterium BMA12]|uniref:GNAT family N-acetyltransferase n=1 Tax=Agaribacillus aureus TaxID=3051825 RepID=A0ABT8LI97_9BACT|nr:GNAT family N-acetyltransferase [Fulvivirgaceae bacterium BMA12]
MNEHLLTLKNIENLTSLWQVVGRAGGSFTRKTNYSFNNIKNSDWPNRIWFDITYDFEVNDILRIRSEMPDLSGSLIIPSWEIFDQEKRVLFTNNGFQEVFEQWGMGLHLNRNFEGSSSADIKTVSTNLEARIFAEAASLSFGYHINPELIERTFGHENIEFYVAESAGKVAGTGILFCSGNIAGIHAVGVVPAMRRKGIAKKLMLHILENAYTKNMAYATLQASEMARPMYLDLGFKDQFRMHNFALQQ